MLLEHFGHDCVILTPKRVPDGQGGFTTTWENGGTFRAAIAVKTTVAGKNAEKAVQEKTYTVLTKRDTTLPFHTVFRSEDLGTVYRIIADNEKATPEVASLDLKEATAEEWRLTE